GRGLKFGPRNGNPMTDTGRLEDPADVMASVPVTSEGIEDVPVNNSVMNFDVCLCDGTVSVDVANGVPSFFRSVNETVASEPFGFTIATPRFFERCPLLSTNNMELVV